jgi:hypothetical protein
MDAAMLIEQMIQRTRDEQPLFDALDEALRNCDPNQQFAVRMGDWSEIEPSRDSRARLQAPPSILFSSRFSFR